MKEGYTLWGRSVFESDIFYNKPPEWFKVWFYIVGKVRHKANKQFKRGENYFCWTSIKGELKGVTQHQYNLCIKWLKLAKQITTQKTTRGNVIFVVNYELYQSPLNYKNEAENEAENEAGTKHKRSTNDAIREECKNVKNEKKKYSVSEKRLSECQSFGETGELLLTPQEYRKLCQTYGGVYVDNLIQAIEDWKLSKGTKYANDNSGIRTWIRRKREEGRLLITWENFREEDFETKSDYEAKINQITKK